MHEQWFRDYILLAFRMEKAIRKFTDSRFVDYYYGPPEWKAEAEAETEREPSALVRDAMALEDTLAEQGFEAHRATYLEKQLIALETVCRKLHGETFTLEDEVRRCFDIHPERIPESQFEQGLAILDETLPGAGSLPDRLHAWRKRYQLAPEQSDVLLSLLQRAAAEARRRTQTIIDLPSDEGIEMRTVNDQVYIGDNQYLGNYHSRVDVNTDLPTDVSGLLIFVCHEGYPGHHTEFVMKEQRLYRERGYLEQAIFPIIGPQAVISEGIARSACEMIFTPDEADYWLAEHIYPEAGIEPDTIDIAQLHAAQELLDYPVMGNAAFLLHEGRSDDEVTRYLMKYMLETEEQARKFLDFLKVPFQEAYIFTYFYGSQLMKPWLEGSDRVSAFRRFLTEQVYPSELARQVD
ncbi:MAG TPA: hypothetical protein VGF38_16440 [Ktedonobacterales bacterium]|jgi:hypothetical protein